MMAKDRKYSQKRTSKKYNGKDINMKKTKERSIIRGANIYTSGVGFTIFDLFGGWGVGGWGGNDPEHKRCLRFRFNVHFI